MHHSLVIFGHVSPPISNQLKLCRLHHRQITRFRSLEGAADVVSNLAPGVVGARRKFPAAVEFPRKALAPNRFSGERFTRRSSVTASNSGSRAARSGGSLPLDRAPL